MKPILVKILRACMRLVADFLGGVHVAPVAEYIARLAACTSWADALQAAQMADLHVVASMAFCAEVAHSLHKSLHGTE